MSLGALATALLIPPVNLPQVAAAGVALASFGGHRVRRVGLWVAALAVAGLIVLAMPFTGSALLASLERDWPPVPAGAPPPAAIVVLGGDETHIMASPGVTVGRLSLERIAAAAALQRRTHLPVLITGGVLHENDEPSVASLMADAMRDDFGGTVRWTEQKSADTWANAADSAAILRRDGINSVYVVTNAWHMPRALIAFAGAGLTAVPAPPPPEAGPRFQVGEFMPSVAGWQASYWGLHEWLGIAYYRLR
jgi:uncharacterized SAM-binding protein YcdF (DUF218 family)